MAGDLIKGKRHGSLHIPCDAGSLLSSTCTSELETSSDTICIRNIEPLNPHRCALQAMSSALLTSAHVTLGTRDAAYRPQQSQAASAGLRKVPEAQTIGAFYSSLTCCTDTDYPSVTAKSPPAVDALMQACSARASTVRRSARLPEVWPTS